MEGNSTYLHKGMRSLQLLLMLINAKQFDHPFFIHLLEHNRRDSLAAIQLVEAEVDGRVEALQAEVFHRLNRMAILHNEPELRRLDEQVAAHMKQIAILKTLSSPCLLEHLREQQRLYQEVAMLMQRSTELQKTIDAELSLLQEEVSQRFRNISDIKFQQATLTAHAENLIRFLRKNTSSTL